MSLESERMVLIASLMLAWTAACPQAWSQTSTQLSLPEGEVHEPWHQAWAEVAASAPSAMAGLQVTIRAAESGWELGVRDDYGARRSVAVDAPRSHAERLDLLYLALSLARPEQGTLSWSDLPGSTDLPPPPEEPEPELAEKSPPTTAPAVSERPKRSFVSASGAPSPGNESETPAEPTEGNEIPTEDVGAPEVAAVAAPITDSLTPASMVLPRSADTASVGARRDPIPILDDPDKHPAGWPSWAWIQGGLGSCWRPQTLPAAEGFLRGGWVTNRVRMGAGARIGTPTRLTAFAKASERSTWNVDLVAGPWIGLFPRIEAGLEAGTALRWYQTAGDIEEMLATPVVALEIAGQTSPAPGARLGLYLRTTVDTVTTGLNNGPSGEDPPDEFLWHWNVALGFHAGGRGQRSLASRE